MLTIEFERLDIKPGYRVLDIGCGDGRHICALARFENVVAVGADRDVAALKNTMDKLNFEKTAGLQGNGQWGLCVADITSLHFPDASFDLVICSEVLEHIGDHEKAVRELLRILKPGHQLVVSVPRYWPERLCWALSKDYHDVEGGHVRIYKKQELVQLFRQHGVRKLAEHYAHSLHSLYWWLKCVLERNHRRSKLVEQYHRLLVWDMMQKPRITRILEKILNPLAGKSLVIYLEKGK